MPREARRIQNREVFRLVNDQIADVAAHLWAAAETRTFICECDRLDCTEEVQAPLEVYDLIRKSPNAYLVRAGHERASETVAFDHGDFRVVLANAET